MSTEIKNENKVADLLLEVVPKIMQILREEMRHGRGEKLTVPQFRVLAHINRSEIKNKELAEKLGVSEAAISRMIDSLDMENLVKKGTSKIDRRQAKLSLTNEGKKLFDQIKSDARLRINKKIANIDPNELLKIQLGLETLQNNVEALQTQVNTLK